MQSEKILGDVNIIYFVFLFVFMILFNFMIDGNFLGKSIREFLELVSVILKIIKPV